MADRTADSSSSSNTEGNYSSKRLRTSYSASNASKVFAEGIDKMEVVRAKGQNKLLETRITGLKAELAEQRVVSEKDRDQFSSSKYTNDARIQTLERELTYIADRERQALERASNAENQLFEERRKFEAKWRKYIDERHTAEDELSEERDRLRTENERLHSELMEEKRQTTQFRYDNAQMKFDVDAMKRQTAESNESIKKLTDELAVMRQKNQALRDEARKVREDSILNSSGDSTTLMESLKQENAGLKKDLDRYKIMSENALALQQHIDTLEEQARRTQEAKQRLVTENYELKTAISKNCKSRGVKFSLDQLDELTQHCVDLKNENSMMDQEIQRLNYELQEKYNIIAQMETDAETRTNEFEIILADKDEAIQACGSRCTELEEALGQHAEAIEQYKEALSQWEVECQRVQEENADLRQRLSPMVGEMAIQTETAGPESVEEYQAALEEQKAKIDSLEARFGLKLDYDPSTTTIVHMNENPLSIARKEYSDRVTSIEAENHMLRLRVEELERVRQRVASTPHDDLEEQPMDEDVTTKVARRLDVEHLDTERKELLERVRKLEEEKQKQMDRVKEIHQNMTREYREVCTMLTGFQLKMKEGGLYVVQSIYDKGRDNYFLVQKGEGNEINLLQNEYTPRWMDFVDTYLMTDHSIPAFLAAVTLSLYEKDKETSTTQDGFAAAASTSMASS